MGGVQAQARKQSSHYSCVARSLSLANSAILYFIFFYSASLRVTRALYIRARLFHSHTRRGSLSSDSSLTDASPRCIQFQSFSCPLYSRALIFRVTE